MFFKFRTVSRLALTLAAFTVVVVGFVNAQTKATSGKAAPLTLEKTIPIAGIAGDFDHFAVDLPGNRLFLAAEEHKTVEVFSLRTAARTGTLKGFDTPHGLLYLPEKKELFVIDGGEGGSCKVVDTTTNSIKKTIPLSPDADALAYDPSNRLLYVTNGGKEAGQDFSMISIIDTEKEEKVGDIKVPSANLESMTIEKSGRRIYVNMRDKNQVGVIDLKNRTFQTSWPLKSVNFNTPMQLDEAHHRVFIAGRNPGKFGVLDTETGKEVTSLAISDGADDMSYDADTGRIYVACGEGFVAVIQQNDADHYALETKVPSGSKGKVGLLVPSLHHYYVVTTKQGTVPAKLLVFKVDK
jgi:DNA-binding beta-propeller fold protein YncE